MRKRRGISDLVVILAILLSACVFFVMLAGLLVDASTLDTAPGRRLNNQGAVVAVVAALSVFWGVCLSPKLFRRAKKG